MSGRADDEAPDALIGSIARELRRPVRLDPALDARVMGEILGAAKGAPAAAPAPERVLAHPVRRGPWRWLVEPKTVRISPLVGLAMAAAFAGIMVLGGRRGASVEPLVVNGDTGGATLVADGPGPSPLAPDASFTHFVFVAPDAKSVALVGDFNDWKVDSIALTPVQNRRGVWSVSVPLPPGRYTYTFVVDGETWVADPSAPPALEDDFGTPKSVVTVGGSQT